MTYPSLSPFLPPSPMMQCLLLIPFGPMLLRAIVIKIFLFVFNFDYDKNKKE